ncbi:YrhK family protein [Aeromicrobium sp. CF4.19]|uniref:YrhK family protein n=1 Tax=Aeromicrobium sp. CF4.19 TaxID=3373082 RepID=UPI003EE68F37
MDTSLTITLGHDELVIRRRYEVLSILNDLLVALWFVVGSILFFFESTTTIGTWFFLVGSLQLMLRPMIRLTRRVHLQRVGDSGYSDTSRDF